ncbi:MAG TPA: hypothetical protein GXZ47_09110 [Treponema sp.]|nr:hypothetical protein [Treponema sp.]
MHFIRDYLVHYYEAGPDYRLTIPALVHYFEDIAILHSSSRGLDLEHYESNHCGWMLIKWDITVYALPSFGDTVQISTWIHAMKTFMADREFRMLAQDGSVLAVARSNWLLMDTVRRRPMRIPEEQIGKFKPMEDSSSFITIDDVPAFEIEETKSVTRVEVRAAHSDIDTNAHVNNVKYIGWAIDSLPADFLAGAQLASLRVQYRKELTPGANAQVITTVSGDTSRHRVCGPDTDYCTVEMHWLRT